jgi:hypothetical protein
MISTEHHWHLREQELLLMKHQEKENIGPALEHYRCYTVYITKTRSSRVLETVEFFPHQFKVPFPSSSELATQAAEDLTQALLNPQPAGPFCQVGDEQAVALRRLANIFGATKLKCGK